MGATTTEHLKREFRARDAFIYSFATISPIAAIYSVFGLVLVAAGPVGWWAYTGVLAVQIVLALALGLMASRWPIEGGGYQWARRLAGPNYGWAAGWMYLWVWIISVASVSYFIAGLLPPLLGRGPFALTQQTMVAMALIALVTGVNVLGPTVLKIFTRICLVAEAIGSVGLAVILLVWHRQQPLSVLTETAGAAHGNYLWAGFFFAVGLIGYSYAGFESVCSMAEEIKDPARHLPKVMVCAVITLGVVIIVSSLALLLAIPDLPAVMLGQVADPASGAIVAALGPGIAKPFLVLILLAFAATLVACHTAASRVLWSFARDGSIPASKFLVKLSGRHNYPIRCLVAGGTLSAVVMVSAFSDKIYTTLVSAATGAFYITISLIVAALAVKVVNRQFQYGPFNFGRVTPAIVLVAAMWVIFEVINLGWPRVTDQPWYVAWAVPLGLGAIAFVGLAVRLSVRQSGSDVGVMDSRDVDAIGDLDAGVSLRAST